MRVFVHCVWIFALLGGTALFGQPAGNRGAGKRGSAMSPARSASRSKPPSAVDQWFRMSPQARERALQKLPPERQKVITERLEKLNSLPTNEKQRLWARYERFSHLSPREQELVRRQIRKFNDLPEDRHSLLNEEFNNLRKMNEKNRQARINSEEFRSKYTLSEQQIVQDLAQILPSPHK